MTRTSDNLIHEHLDAPTVLDGLNEKCYVENETENISHDCDITTHGAWFNFNPNMDK